MLPIGTKVKRGPDWDPEYDNQDTRNGGTGIGIVVSHNRWDFNHRVQWLKANGETSCETVYRYDNKDGKRDILPIDPDDLKLERKPDEPIKETEGMRLFNFFFTSEHERAKLNSQPLNPLRDFFDNLPDVE